MKKTFPKNWQHGENEAEIYKNWETKGFFKPETVEKNSKKQETITKKITNSKSQIPNENEENPNAKDQKLEIRNLKFEILAKPFVIAMPPPNVTGRLHIGHALGTTLQDLMTRYHRLQGQSALYVPGMDHAGIATQSVVDKYLRKQNINKNEIGREKFVAEVWKWKEQYGGTILEQLRALGASCDWSREKFTLDEEMSAAVRKAFVHLYEKNLIYCGEYIVNWCPKCGTAIADDEVEHQTQKAKLYFFKYDKNFPITIATTRPETKLGDVAVAVNPSDERYKKFVGQSFDVEIDGIKRKIKVIADRTVDQKFGTGAVGLTPAHSMIDWRIAEENNLPKIKVIDEHGRLVNVGEKYSGLKVLEAREKLVEYLSSENLLEKTEEIENNLAICYRCGGAIEPLPSLQWFVKMKPLAVAAKEAVSSGKIKIIPKRFEKVYFHWLDNIRDWCISRQLWWGQQIPVFYKKQEFEIKDQRSKIKNLENISDLGNLSNLDEKDIFVGETMPAGGDWVQDEDVLDTWFSSALWPFSTLGWPNESSPDLEKYFPTTVMETGYDILFFWVARMIMMSLELTGEIPFETVYLHGLVRDEKNRKMSKSLGNILDPLDLIAKYGTDALRMALVVGSTPGQDLAVGEGKIKGFRNFTNKIWNASRFVALRVTDGDLQSGELGEFRIKNSELRIMEGELSEADKKILASHEKVKASVKNHLDKFQFSLAGEELYEYFWHQFCDEYIEVAKTQLDGLPLRGTTQSDSEKIATPDGLAMTENTKKILLKILSESLIMLHPFVPFVTEAVWQELRQFTPDLAESIMIAEWPQLR
ncbi:MAG: valine--tRNA ligase [Candidatus Berkelbacteria bacterium]|nr:valine--tRNA ligase [Candidatus Berkelbacteria bacterium]